MAKLKFNDVKERRTNLVYEKVKYAALFEVMPNKNLIQLNDGDGDSARFSVQEARALYKWLEKALP